MASLFLYFFLSFFLSLLFVFVHVADRAEVEMQVQGSCEQQLSGINATFLTERDCETTAVIAGSCEEGVRCG